MYSIFGMLCHRVHVDNENVHPFAGSTSKINAKRIVWLAKTWSISIVTYTSIKSFERLKSCNIFMKTYMYRK